MDRISFFESVNGIKYPEMLVNFFDQFIALKHIVEDNGFVRVIDNDNINIKFSITFKSIESKNNALEIINSLGGSISIYNRPISINIESLTDSEIQIKLS